MELVYLPLSLLEDLNLRVPLLEVVIADHSPLVVLLISHPRLHSLLLANDLGSFKELTLLSPQLKPLSFFLLALLLSSNNRLQDLLLIERKLPRPCLLLDPLLIVNHLLEVLPPDCALFQLDLSRPLLLLLMKDQVSLDHLLVRELLDLGYLSPLIPNLLLAQELLPMEGDTVISYP